MSTKNRFLPKTRKAIGRPPWGYVADKADQLLLIPMQEPLETLEAGFDFLDAGGSFRKTADWIKAKCGESISSQGLKNFYERAEGEEREAGRERRANLVVNYSHKKNRKKKRISKEERLNKEIGQLKRSITLKKQKLTGKPAPVPPPLLSLPAEAKPETTNYEIRPNEGPQTDFLSASEDEVLFGGQAGGGKSFGITVDPLRTVHLPSHKAITFRKTNDELRQLIQRSKELFPKVIKGAKWREADKTWDFPSGATHWFRYLDRDDDVEAMQGQDFSHIYFDELTHWPTPYVYTYMRSRKRSADPAIRPYVGMRSTTNPGGPGHGWVKKMFIDPAPANTSFVGVDMETGEPMYWTEDDPASGHYIGDPLYTAKFIPSKLSDNPYLNDDGAYRASLLSMPEVQRKQLLEGDWDVAVGAAFSEFDRQYHVCEPFQIPLEWPRFRACDWGYEAPACCLWIAVDYDGKLWVYRELYVTRMVASDFADKIADMESGDRVNYGVLDSSCWSKRGDGGPSVAEVLNKRGCNFRPSDRSPGSRIQGKQELHRRLKVTERPSPTTGLTEKYTGLTIVNNCVNLIRTLPALPLDKTNTEDVNTKVEDHAYDALRYGCATRPMLPVRTNSSSINFNSMDDSRDDVEHYFES